MIMTSGTPYFKVDANYSKKSFITKTSAIDGNATFSLFTFFSVLTTAYSSSLRRCCDYLPNVIWPNNMESSKACFTQRRMGLKGLGCWPHMSIMTIMSA